MIVSGPHAEVAETVCVTGAPTVVVIGETVLGLMPLSRQGSETIRVIVCTSEGSIPPSDA